MFNKIVFRSRDHLINSFLKLGTLTEENNENSLIKMIRRLWQYISTRCYVYYKIYTHIYQISYLACFTLFYSFKSFQ